MARKTKTNTKTTAKPRSSKTLERAVRKSRWQFVSNATHMLEMPMIMLAFVWMALVIYSLVNGSNQFIKHSITVIWYLFAAEFVMRGLVAPNKWDFLKHNWLAAISLFLPALRTLQIFAVVSSLPMLGALAAGNSIVFLLLGSVNRGMQALRKVVKRRGTVYVAALTVIILCAGAAGMLAAEKHVHAPNGIHSYPQALYWTAMMITTIGSDYWPATPQGKTLCVALSLYAVSILGYIAGSLASFFVGNDAHDPEGDVASEKELRALRKQLASLQEQLQQCMLNKDGD